MTADVESLTTVVMRVADLPQPVSQRLVADTIRVDRRLLLLFVDGIDEARDYDKLDNLLTKFRASPLAEVTQLILLCRTEGVPGLSDILARNIPELPSRTSPGHIILDDLTDEESTELLVRSGASRGEIRIIDGWLPPDLRRKPLFLLATLAANRQSPLPTRGERDVVGALATHYVRDIVRRLTRDGRRPADFVVQVFLEDIAIECLRSASGGVLVDGWAAISGGADDGEDSLRRRAIQSGVLVEDAQSATTFTHGALLEHFAVSALARIPMPSWTLRVPSLVTERGRGIALRLVAALPDPSPLVDLLLAHNERLACEVAAHTRFEIDEALQVRIIDILRRGLCSRFPSERRRAVRLLGGLKGRKVQVAAAAWWNGLGSAKPNEVLPAAEMFLKLQMPEAADLILLHRGFHSSPDLPWFEPAFVQVIQALPTGFKEQLCSVGRKRLAALDPRANDAGPYVKALAILGDDEHLTDLLRRALEQGALNATCHRALIFINTGEALAVFRDSVDLQIGWLRAHREEDRDRAWDRLVLHGTDIAMYPHECLLALVEVALESPCRDHNWFGLRWAERIPNLRLLQPCADALQRQHANMISITSSAIEKIMRISKFGDVLAAFEQGSPRLQGMIVHHLHHVPSVQTEQFLIECLNRDEHRLSAIQSLGFLRSVRGAAAVRRWFRNGDDRIKVIAANALSQIRNAEAVSDLADELDRAGSHVSERVDLEYSLVRALGRIGGDEATGRLVRAYPRCHNKDHVLRQILRSKSQRSIEAVRTLVGDGDGPLIVAALARRNLDDLLNDEVAQPWIRDDVLCSYVLAEAETTVRTRHCAVLANPIRAIAAFDLRQAHQFLQDTAELDLAPEPDEPMRMTLDPVRDARTILARRGHRTYARLAIEHELALIGSQRFVLDSALHRLRSWPPPLVKEVLLEYLARLPNAMLIFLFSWFAEAEDRDLFEQWEQLPDVSAADAAHKHLMDHPS